MIALDPWRHMKSPLAVVVLLAIVGCTDNQHLSTKKAERILHTWNPQAERSLAVIGVQEFPINNAAQADLAFSKFEFQAAGLTFGPFSIKPPSKQYFTGTGEATFKRYTDGRWVLTTVRLHDRDGTYWQNLNVSDRQSTTKPQFSELPPPAGGPNNNPPKKRPAPNMPYVVVSRCHACAWASWQKDSLAPLNEAGFNTMTGSFAANGKFVASLPTSWEFVIYVGPFSDHANAQRELRRIVALLKPVATAHFDQVALFKDEIGDERADFAGYTLVVALP
jgi:hypothetical protein